ncbi:hypothetical protein ACTFIV_009558 [Dictyostelium citrinum]
MNFSRSLKLINKNGIKSMFSPLLLNKPIYIRKQSGQLFFSSKNHNDNNNINNINNNINNNNNNNNIKKNANNNSSKDDDDNSNYRDITEEDKKSVRELVEKAERESEMFKKIIAMDEEKTGFKYVKSPHIKFTDDLNEEIFRECENTINSQKKDNQFFLDYQKEREEAERNLKKQTFRNNVMHYIITVLLIIMTIKYYYIFGERAKNFKETFDENWEALRVIVNNRDSQKEKRSKLIDSFSTFLQQLNNDKNNNNNNNNTVDLDEIKEDVESIINQYCIENKSPKQITIDNNNDISNSKI